MVGVEIKELEKQLNFGGCHADTPPPFLIQNAKFVYSERPNEKGKGKEN